MGRISRTSSATVVTDPIRAETDQVERLLARLNRALGHAGADPAMRSAGTTLVKRYAAFTATGDPDADRSTLAAFEQQATALLRKAQKQQRDRR